MSKDEEKSGRDVELETGEHVREPVTVLGLLDEMRQDFRKFQEFTFPDAELNERYYAGEQRTDYDSGEDALLALHGFNRPDATRNYLRSLVLTWAARIMEDRPTVRAWPSDGSYFDRAATEAANALIEHMHERMDIDAMMERAAVLAQCHTCVGIKITWDGNGGRREKVTVIDEESGVEVYDPDTGERLVTEGDPLGEVRWDLVTVFDYLTDGAEDIADSSWCAFRAFMTEDEARARMKAAGLDEDPAVSTFENIWRIERQAVEAWEIWHLPTERLPGGLFATVIGGHVVDVQDWPEGYPGLPLAVWKVGDRSSHPHGTTHVSDALPIQRRINEICRTQAKMLNDVGEHVRLIAPSRVVEAWEQENQLIPVDDPEQAALIRWVAPPYEALAGIHDEIGREREALFEVFGLNEYLTGQSDMKASASGKAIAYLKELDSKKLAMAARNFGKCIKRAFSHSLQLWQAYGPPEDIIEITGPDGMPEVQAFKRAMLRGVDVRLEPMSGAERWRAARAGSAMEQAAGGFRDPKQAMAMQATGLEETGGEVDMRQRAQEQINAVLSGTFVQPDPQIDPTVAQQEISEAIDVNQGAAAPQALMALQMLRMQYAQMGQQKQAQKQQQQPQQGRPKPKPRPQGGQMQQPNVPGSPGPLGGGGSFQ